MSKKVCSLSSSTVYLVEKDHVFIQALNKCSKELSYVLFPFRPSTVSCQLLIIWTFPEPHIFLVPRVFELTDVEYEFSSFYDSPHYVHLEDPIKPEERQLLQISIVARVQCVCPLDKTSITKGFDFFHFFDFQKNWEKMIVYYPQSN